MGKYYEKLIEQFKNANEIKNVDIDSDEFINEFTHWLKNRQLIGEDYKSFIEFMDVSLSNGYNYVEIGKGNEDTLVINTPVSIITPYTEGIVKPAGAIIKAKFKVCDNKPMFSREYEKYDVVNTHFINRFLTHNPYSEIDIRNWQQLHNSGSNITVGVYGSIYDKDIAAKTQQLKELAERMYEGFEQDYTVDGDEYFYAISSNRKQKVLQKTLNK